LLEANTLELLNRLKERIIPDKVATEPKDEIPTDENELWKYALAKTKEKFRLEMKINPDMPGWAGWVNTEAKKLFSALKRKLSGSKQST
jgi:hypothetical protein